MHSNSLECYDYNFSTGIVCVCVCVVIPFILGVRLVDAPAGVTQEEAHQTLTVVPENKSLGIRYFSTGQVVSSSKCTSTSHEAGRLRTKLVTGNVSDKAS